MQTSQLGHKNCTQRVGCGEGQGCRRFTGQHDKPGCSSEVEKRTQPSPNCLLTSFFFFIQPAEMNSCPCFYCVFTAERFGLHGSMLKFFI